MRRISTLKLIYTDNIMLVLCFHCPQVAKDLHNVGVRIGSDIFQSCLYSFPTELLWTELKCWTDSYMTNLASWRLVLASF